MLMSALEITATVLGAGGLITGLANMFKYCAMRKKNKQDIETGRIQMKHLEQAIEKVEKGLPENRIVAARKKFEGRMKTDPEKNMKVEEDYEPFQSKTAIEAVIEREMSQKRATNRGVVLVCGPPDCGKTTRVHYVAHKLFRDGDIRGAITFDFDNVEDPMETVYKSFDADKELLHDGILSLIPEASKDEYKLGGGKRPTPIILIFDQVEKVKGKVGREKLLEFVLDLATKSVKPGVGKDFLTFVICSDARLAARVLALNGKRKVRTPEMKFDIVERYKWKSDDCEGLINKFDKDNKLGARVKQKLVECAIESGTPGFIRNFFLCNPEPTMADLERFASESSDKTAWDEWRDLHENVEKLIGAKNARQEDDSQTVYGSDSD